MWCAMIKAKKGKVEPKLWNQQRISGDLQVVAKSVRAGTHSTCPVTQLDINISRWEGWVKEVKNLYPGISRELEEM